MALLSQPGVSQCVLPERTRSLHLHGEASACSTGSRMLLLLLGLCNFYPRFLSALVSFLLT